MNIKDSTGKFLVRALKNFKKPLPFEKELVPYLIRERLWEIFKHKSLLISLYEREKVRPQNKFASTFFSTLLRT
jgi:hypothetical protein